MDQETIDDVTQEAFTVAWAEYLKHYDPSRGYPVQQFFRCRASYAAKRAAAKEAKYRTRQHIGLTHFDDGDTSNGCATVAVMLDPTEGFIKNPGYTHRKRYKGLTHVDDCDPERE